MPTMEAMLADLGMAAAGVLAAPFAWAGAAKIGQPADTEDGFRSLGLGLAPALARGGPALELLLAVALLAAPRVGGVVALALLAAFSAVIMRALRGGGEVRCACFGQAGGRLLSGAELVRNGLLGVLAALAIAAGLEPRVPSVAAASLMASAVLAGGGGLLALRRHRS